MSNLGRKFSCAECGAKFYDLGKELAICPRCGADQTELRSESTAMDEKADQVERELRELEEDTASDDDARDLFELGDESSEEAIEIDEAIGGNLGEEPSEDEDEEELED